MRMLSNKFGAAIIGLVITCLSCKDTILPITDHRAYILGREESDVKGKKSRWQMHIYDSLWIYESELLRCYRFVKGIEEPFLTNDLEDCNPGSPSYPEIYFTVFKFKLSSGEFVYHLSTSKLGEAATSSFKSIPLIESNQQMDTKEVSYSEEIKSKLDQTFEDRKYVNSLLEYTGLQANGYSTDTLKSIHVTKNSISKKWALSGGRFRAKTKKDPTNILFEYETMRQDQSFILRNIIVVHPTKIGNDKPIIMNLDTLTEMKNLKFDLVLAANKRDSVYLPKDLKSGSRFWNANHHDR